MFIMNAPVPEEDLRYANRALDDLCDLCVAQDSCDGCPACALREIVEATPSDDDDIVLIEDEETE